MSGVKRGPQEAQGRLLPFSCMQEKQLIIRVVWEGRVIRAPFSHVQQVKLIRWEREVLQSKLEPVPCVCVSGFLRLWNLCLLFIRAGMHTSINKRSKSVIWHLRAADDPPEMTSAVVHFLEYFELLQTRCKTCHWSRKPRLLHKKKKPSPTGLWLHPGGTRTGHKAKKKQIW